MNYMRMLEERALSRRRFLRTAAGAAGALGAGLWWPRAARADDDDDIVLPKPIPGGLQIGTLLGVPTSELFHYYFPGPGNEPSTIFDFDGAVGVAEILGTGTGKNTKTGQTTKLFFVTDFRFMKGKYIGVDGRQHHGTLSFF